MRLNKGFSIAAAAALSLGVFAAQGNASVISWDFSTVTGASPPTVTSAPATTGAAANLTIGSISGVGDAPTTQTGVFNNASSNVYPGASGGNDYGLYIAPGTTAVGSTGYLQVTFTPDAGYLFQLNDLDFGARATATGPKNYSIRWSVDNYASDILASAIDISGSSWKFYNSSFTSVTDPTSEPVTVRLYMYGGTGNPGTSANMRFDDVAFDVSSTAVLAPEPASAALLALAGLPLLSGRRRKA